jgi:hypothetical protein
MARFDKYDPLGGGFRARLAAGWAVADGTSVGVGLDISGHVVAGAGNSCIVGAVALVGGTPGKAVDVMTAGEIVDVNDTGFSGRAAGIPVYAVPATGAMTATALNNIKIGHMVEADRLVVRKGASAGTGA